MTELENIFNRYQNESFAFVRPGGNWGDHLIYHGAERLARDLGIDFSSWWYEEYVSSRPPNVGCVYLHGGGGFNSWTTGRALKGLVHAMRTHSGPVIQGPQTTEISDDYLMTMRDALTSIQRASPTYLFVREKISYERLKDYFCEADKIEVLLSQDTALYLDRAFLRHIAGISRSSRYVLDAFREDNEQTGMERAAYSGPSAVALDPAIYARSFSHWVKIHALSREIRTNRTHSAIAGAILEIPTTIFGSSSHKNRGIWSYSLKARGVAWGELPTSFEPRRDRVATDAPFPTRIQRLERIANRLKDWSRPFYRFVNLPRFRAEFTKVWQRGRHRLRGVPWR